LKSKIETIVEGDEDEDYDYDKEDEKTRNMPNVSVN
jgi:hypothetical protein